MFELGGR